jgi:hypothetical protein
MRSDDAQYGVERNLVVLVGGKFTEQLMHRLITIINKFFEKEKK